MSELLGTEARCALGKGARPHGGADGGSSKSGAEGGRAHKLEVEGLSVFALNEFSILDRRARVVGPAQSGPAAARAGRLSPISRASKRSGRSRPGGCFSPKAHNSARSLLLVRLIPVHLSHATTHHAHHTRCTQP